MATDARMDQPISPAAFSEAMAVIRAKIMEVESALTARAQKTGSSFLYRSKHDAETSIEVLVTPRNLIASHNGGSVCVREQEVIGDGTTTQLLLALAKEAPRLCAQAAEFYDQIATLRAADCTSALDRALARLAMSEQDDRGASMPRL